MIHERILRCQCTALAFRFAAPSPYFGIERQLAQLAEKEAEVILWQCRGVGRQDGVEFKFNDDRRSFIDKMIDLIDAKLERADYEVD